MATPTKNYRVTRNGLYLHDDTNEPDPDLSKRQGYYFEAYNSFLARHLLYQHLKENNMLLIVDTMYGFDVQEKW